MQSILEILTLSVKAGNSKKTGLPFSITEAHCVIRNDDGSAAAVGVLVVPKALEGSAKVGLFTATFGLVAGSFGDNQGRIVAQLAGLMPFVARPVSAAK
jgi:hypothetical protein